jgi:hypothetical protein
MGFRIFKCGELKHRPVGYENLKKGERFKPTCGELADLWLPTADC